MRSRLLLSLILMLIAAAGWYVAWRVGGRTGLLLAMVVLSPLAGIALALVFAQLLGHSVQTVRTIAYRDIEGRHFEYKGRPLAIREDLAGDRWIRTRDIRRIVANLPRDDVLARRAPAGVGRMDGEKGVFFLAQELGRYLERSRDEGTIRFRTWLQREVISPTPRARQLALRPPAGDEPAPHGNPSVPG